MNNPLRGALVGYGFIMEKGHGAAYRQRLQGGWSGGAGRGEPDVQIVAVADVSEARRRLDRKSVV